MTYAVRTDRHGGIPRNFVKALSAEKRKEAAGRMQFAASKDALRARHDLEQDRIADSRVPTRRSIRRSHSGDRWRVWRSQGRRQSPGIFFAEINGVQGYWRRPKSTAPTGPRRKGVRQVLPEGAPTLLLKVQDTTTYKELFRYNEVIEEAYREFGAPAEFARELDRAISKAIDKTSGGPTVPAIPSGGGVGYRKLSFPPR